MSTRATILGLTIVLAGCSSSHSDRSALATPQPTGAATAASVSPSAALVTPSAVVAPRSGASEAAKAAGAEARKSTIPKTIPSVRAVPVGGAATAGGALPQGVPYASDSDPVQIVSYVLSSTIIHPGDNVTGDVVTTSNAASVTAQVGAFSVAVPKIAPGKFHLLMQLPSLPLPLGDAKLIITAIRTDGKRTTREVPITVAQ